MKRWFFIKINYKPFFKFGFQTMKKIQSITFQKQIFLKTKTRKIYTNVIYFHMNSRLDHCFRMLQM